MQNVGRTGRWCLVGAFVAGGWILSAGTGRAQEATQGWLFNLSGAGQQVGQALADKGIYLTGGFLGQSLNVVSGGRQQGSFYDSFTSVGADFDMNKIAGINGGIVHLLVSDLAGQSYANYTGSYFAYAVPYAYGDGFRLNEFSYEQELFDNRVRILAGRINLTGDFDISPIQCQFMTTICSNLPGYVFDKSAVGFNTSSWGATMTLKPSKPTYVKFGVYEDEPSVALSNQMGWPGKDWDFQSAAGATIPVQIGYHTTPQDDPYPRAYDIGGFYDTATYADPLLNTAGQARVLSGGSPLEHTGRSGVYLQAQQMVYRPDPKSDRGLTLFGAANWTTSGETAIANDVMVGLYDKGPLASRPNDSLGVALTFIASNHRVTQDIDDTIIAQGGTGHVSSEEAALEVNYGIGLAPGITLIPFMQYVSHPDQYINPTPSGNLNYSLTVGVGLSIGFNQALGLPQLTRGGY
ncbi:MAG TPA: carbohydrate porin [Rhodopila sp.]|nr:carbohydrate porin [Rhodopila sp.]